MSREARRKQREALRAARRRRAEPILFVVHVDRQRSFTGQIQRGLSELDALRGAGHRVGVIAHPGSALARAARERGLLLWELPMRGRAIYASMWRAGRALRGRGVDVLHCHGGADHVLAVGAARLAGVPHLVRTKHNHTPPRGWRHRVPYRLCDRVVAVSGFVRAQLVAAGLEAWRVVSIPTAVDLARFRPRPRDAALAASLGIGAGELVIGNVSSLHRRKGIEELLRAFALLRRGPHGERVRGLLVGKNGAQWQPLARELGIADRVIFPGFREDVSELLPLFDVYALPSHHEALGTGALEAMAAGLALVVGDVEGLAEAVAPGTGLRVPPGDVARLAAAIASLLGDPARRRALGEAARARAVAEYGREAQAARMLACYEEVLRVGGRAADAGARA
jgi:glycosyltransferase involved in cell wall biosynthesis